MPRPLQRYFRGVKSYIVSRNRDHDPFVSRQLGLATINVQTKFEVSNYTQYLRMNM